MSAESNLELTIQNVSGKIISTLSWFKPNVRKAALEKVNAHFQPDEQQLTLAFPEYSHTAEREAHDNGQ